MKAAESNLRKLIRGIILESKEFRGLALGSKGKVEISQKEFDDKIQKCVRLLEDWSYLPPEHSDKDSWQYKAWLESADDDARIRNEFTRLATYLYNSKIIEKTVDGEEKVYYDDIDDLLAYIESFLPESSRFAHAIFNLEDSGMLASVDHDHNPQLASVMSKLSTKEFVDSDFYKAAERSHRDNIKRKESILSGEDTGSIGSTRLDWVKDLRRKIGSRVKQGSIAKSKRGIKGMSIEGGKK